MKIFNIVLSIALPAVLLAGCASSQTPAVQPTLFQRLGGMEKITLAAQQLVDNVSRDPRTKRSFEGVNLKRLKVSVASHLCSVADGPCRYEGETMAVAHTGMALTDAEFDLMGRYLEQALLQQGAAAHDIRELDAILGKMRPDILGK